MSDLEIRKVSEGFRFYNCMEDYDRFEIKVHDHGLVALVDVMPRMVPIGRTADFAIAQAARTSTGQGLKSIKEDYDLIRYMMRNKHTSPFEMIEFKFHHVMPIFIARQWIRHRTANVNEFSARYSILKDRFYRPSGESLRKQSSTNKQGRSQEMVEMVTATEFEEYLDDSEKLYASYEKMIDLGISRELARIALPLSIYTEWYWKIDLHNLFHFLQLRMDSHAQQEIQDYANAMYALVKQIVPVSCRAFEDYRMNSVTLSVLEVAAIRDSTPLSSTNEREQSEFEVKKGKLGIK